MTRDSRSASARKWVGLLIQCWLGVGCFVAMYWVTSSAYRPDWLGGTLRTANAVDSTIYSPSHEVLAGDQLVLVYIGAAACGWSNTAEMPRLIERIKIQMAAQARQRGWSFIAVGIAIDWDTRLGTIHLNKFGRFDEIAVGNNWGNDLALHFLGAQRAELPSTPQVIAVHRHVERADFALGPFTPTITSGDILYRAAGEVEVKRWVRNGAILPQVNITTPRERRTQQASGR